MWDSVAEGSGTGAEGTSTEGTSTEGTTSGEASSEASGPTSDTGESTGDPTGGKSTAGSTTRSTGDTADTDDAPLICADYSLLTIQDGEVAARKLAGYNCISGAVRILPGSGADLSFLSEIRAIGGDLRIVGPHPLVSLHGLEKLESVGGHLELGETPALADASALAGLQSIGGYFELEDAPQLTALELGSLTSIDGDLAIDASSLTSLEMPAAEITGGLHLLNTKLEALTGLTAVTGLRTLVVRGNTALTSLLSLAGVTVEKDVRIDTNPSLTSLPPLVGETESLYLNYNPGLVDLSGLEGLTITTSFEVRLNDGLISLKGFGAFGDALSRVEIYDNPSPASIDALPGLVSVAEVDIIVNPLLTSLGPLATLEAVDWLRIGLTNVTTLAELDGIESMDALMIHGNPALTALTGLEDLASVRVLSIRDNPKLTALTALQDGALAEVTETFDVAANPALPSCAAKALYDKLNGPPADYCYENLEDKCSELSGCEVILDMP